MPEHTGYDGERVPVGVVECRLCRNYFFVPFADIEPPNFCAYCGQAWNKDSFNHVEPQDMDLTLPDPEEG